MELITIRFFTLDRPACRALYYKFKMETLLLNTSSIEKPILYTRVIKKICAQSSHGFLAGSPKKKFYVNPHCIIPVKTLSIKFLILKAH